MRLLICLSFLVSCSLALGADALKDDPERWFRDGYAPLWSQAPGEQLDAMLTYYAPTIITHAATGEVTTEDSTEWLAPAVNTWLAEGWLRAELSGLITDPVNESTVVFKARWTDFYAEAPEEVSCGWYLADRQDGKWTFSSYADLDCEAHGL